ncbi:MAG: aldolase [Alphaproteobacteria bacterium]|nr:aldolase [Alphaproteobacteria bacterium]
MVETVKSSGRDRDAAAESTALSQKVRQGRIDLAVAFRWSARLGFHEAIANHYSLAVAEDGREFLMNPAGRHWSKLQARDILLLDVGGRILAGDGELDPTAYYLHSAIHRLVPRARCVLHTHMPYATALTSLEDGRLEMISQNAARFYGRVVYDDAFNGMALSMDEAERICGALSRENASVLFMANHGVMVIGRSVAHAFDELYYLEKSCENQVLAMSTGKTLKRLPDEVARLTCKQWVEYPNFSEGHFAELKRILDAEEPEYAE